MEPINTQKLPYKYKILPYKYMILNITLKWHLPTKLTYLCKSNITLMNLFKKLYIKNKYLLKASSSQVYYSSEKKNKNKKKQMIEQLKRKSDIPESTIIDLLKLNCN